MNHLKRLGLAFTLMSVLALTAFAGETEGPPCVPGQTNSPPCSSQPVNDDSSAPRETLIDLGQTGTPPASDGVDLVDIVNATLWALSLF